LARDEAEFSFEWARNDDEEVAAHFLQLDDVDF
jgi:hypothetical protein